MDFPLAANSLGKHLKLYSGDMYHGSEVTFQEKGWLVCACMEVIKPPKIMGKASFAMFLIFMALDFGY